MSYTIQQHVDNLPRGIQELPPKIPFNLTKSSHRVIHQLSKIYYVYVLHPRLGREIPLYLTNLVHGVFGHCVSLYFRSHCNFSLTIIPYYLIIIGIWSNSSQNFKFFYRSNPEALKIVIINKTLLASQITNISENSNTYYLQGPVNMMKSQRFK